MRIIGVILMAAAFSALIVDGTRSIAGRQILIFSVGETIGWLAPAKLAGLTQSADMGPPIAKFLLAQVLMLPTWLATGVSALLFLGAGRRPRATNRYSTDR